MRTSKVKAVLTLMQDGQKYDFPQKWLEATNDNNLNRKLRYYHEMARKGFIEKASIKIEDGKLIVTITDKGTQLKLSKTDWLERIDKIVRILGFVFAGTIIIIIIIIGKDMANYLKKLYRREQPDSIKSVWNKSIDKSDTMKNFHSYPLKNSKK